MTNPPHRTPDEKWEYLLVKLAEGYGHTGLARNAETRDLVPSLTAVRDRNRLAIHAEWTARYKAAVAAGSMQYELKRSEYDPDTDPDALIACMAKGHGPLAYAGQRGVSLRCLYHWADADPEFALAMKIGKAKRALHWEAQAIDTAETGKGSPPLIMRALAGLGGDPETWSEKQQHEVSGADGAPLGLSVVFRKAE